MQHLSAAGQLALTFALAAAFISTVAAEEPTNLLSNGGAEQVAKNDNPTGWFMASVPAATLRLFVDRGHSRAGDACLAISNRHEYDSPVANNWGQKILAIPRGKTVRLTAYIRTAEVGTANVCLQCWADEGQRMVAFASTPVIHGTSGWTLAEADKLVVPPETTLMIVRAALMGPGTAYFDDITLEIVERSAAAATASDVAARNPYEVGGEETDLAKQVRDSLHGQLVRSVPVSKDCMVLAYLPTWNHGHVDNIAVANNHGGVRTLMAWPKPSAEEIATPKRRFFLALYCRKTTSHGTPGPIGVYEVLDDWNERTAWEKQPRLDDLPATTACLTAGEGWKLFDVTPLVRKHAADDNLHGAVLRFDAEDLDTDWSGYAFASREATGKDIEHRPLLLLVEPESSR